MVTLVLLATVVPRVLGPGDYGRFSVPLTIVTLGSLALTLGGPTVLARFVPAAAPEQRLAVARSLGRRLARGRGLQLAVIAGVAALGSVLVARRASRRSTPRSCWSRWRSTWPPRWRSRSPWASGGPVPWSTRYPLQNAVLIVAVLALRESAGGTGGPVAIAGRRSRRCCVRRRRGRTDPAAAGRSGGRPRRRHPLRRPAGHGRRARAGRPTGAASSPSRCWPDPRPRPGYAALATGIALGVTYAVLQAFTVSLPHLADGADDADARGGPAPRWPGGLLVAAGPGGARSAPSLLDRLVPLVFGDALRGRGRRLRAGAGAGRARPARARCSCRPPPCGCGPTWLPRPGRRRRPRSWSWHVAGRPGVGRRGCDHRGPRRHRCRGGARRGSGAARRGRCAPGRSRPRPAPPSSLVVAGVA